MPESTCSLNYKHRTIVNGDSSIVSKCSSKFIDNARVVIYDCNMFITQAKIGAPFKSSIPHLARLTSLPTVFWLSWQRTITGLLVQCISDEEKGFITKKPFINVLNFATNSSTDKLRCSFTLIKYFQASLILVEYCKSQPVACTINIWRL